MRSDPSWKTLDPGRLAYELVRAAMAKDGGMRPENAIVSVIRADKNGVKWLNRGACGEEAGTRKSARRRVAAPASLDLTSTIEAFRQIPRRSGK